MQEKLAKKIIIVVLIIMVLVAVIGTALVLTTEIFKPKSDLFKKYFEQNFKAIAGILDISEEEKYINLIKDTNYYKTTKGTIKYLEGQNDEEELYNIIAATVNSKSQENYYKKIRVKYEDNILTDLEVLKEKEMYGVRFPILEKQFLTVKNANLRYFLSNIGLEGKYFNETLNKVDFIESFKLHNDELRSLKDNYINAIFNGINNEWYTSKNDTLITLENGETITVKSYSVTLNKNELDKVYKRVYNALSEDKTIAKKLDEIEAKIIEAGLKTGQEKSLKELFSEYFSKKATEIEYAGEDDTKTVFTVYEQKGITVRTEIKEENGNRITIDIPFSGEGINYNKNIIIRIEKLNETGITTYKIALSKKVDNGNLIREVSFEDDINQIKIINDLSNNEDKINSNVDFYFSNEKIKKFNLVLSSEFNLNGNKKIPASFENDNNIILNDIEPEKVKVIFKALENLISKNLNENQTKLNLKCLKRITDNIYSKQTEEKEQEQKEKEQKIKEFNNQFEIYSGENLNYENMQRLLDVISKNIKEYKIVNGNTIEVIIEEGESNKEKENEIRKAITKKYTYNAKFKYNEDGKINAIDIFLYNKNN